MIYIQSDSDKTMPHHFDCACALYGSMASNLDYRLTSFEEVSSGKFDNLIKTNLFVGSVEFMREVFNRINITDVRVPKNSNREHRILTLKEAHLEVSNGKSIFIKPFEIKLFTGLVLDGCQYSCLENLPEETKVMVYEPFKSELISEWRLYIHNGGIIDAHNYSGDVLISPNRSDVETIIKNDCINFPKAYTIDIGILEDKTNVVVEFNDMWAIGNYGIPNNMYIRLLRDRYFEIVRAKKTS